MNKRILVAAAWPYANGSLHLGHVSSLIGSDILARYFRLAGDDVLFVSGSDCHGAPIAFEADRLGVKPVEIADRYHQEFVETLINGLRFSYDLYTKTTTDNHRSVVQEVFLTLSRINQELIGNFGNFVYRTLSFIKAKFPQGVSFPTQPDKESSKFLALAKETFPSVGSSIEAGRFREGLRSILKLAEDGNRYLSNAAPWVSIKVDPAKTESDLAVAAHVIKCLAILVNPFLPKTAELILKDIGFNQSEISWSDPVPGITAVSKTAPLYKKIETPEIEEQLHGLGNENSANQKAKNHTKAE